MGGGSGGCSGVGGGGVRGTTFFFLINRCVAVFNIVYKPLEYYLRVGWFPGDYYYSCC